MTTSRPEEGWNDVLDLPDLLTDLWRLPPLGRGLLHECLMCGELGVVALRELLANRQSPLQRPLSSDAVIADLLRYVQALGTDDRIVAENPADNPEGIADGRTVDNGVATREDLSRQFAQDSSGRASARVIAGSIPLGRPTTPRPISDAPGWPDPEPGRALAYAAAAPPTVAQKLAANEAFLRLVTDARDAIRQAVEATHPSLLSPEERRAFDALRQVLADLLVVVI